MTKILTKATLVQDSPAPLPVKLERGQTVLSGEALAGWLERQWVEIQVGRAEEPLLYTDIYNLVSDPSLPRHVSVYQMRSGAVILNGFLASGEVVFITVNDKQAAIPLKQYAMALEYQDMLVYNELWNVPSLERDAGKAFNAVLNHIHLAPFLLTQYPADHQSAAIYSMPTRLQNIIRTLEDAVTESKLDKLNPRRGNYALLVSSADVFAVERALIMAERDEDSSVGGNIHLVVAYDGWIGKRGDKEVYYPGVNPGKAYLIDLAWREHSHQSYTQKPLSLRMAVADGSAVLIEQAVGDTIIGVYCDPLASTQEIWLPEKR